MTEEKNDYFNDQQRSITLIDFFIVILKHKLLISAAVLIPVLMAFIYLNISMKSTPSKPSVSLSVPQKYYSSETFLELNMDIVQRFSIICMNESISEKILSKYHLSMLRYMMWDEKKQNWIIDRIYSWDGKNQKLMINDHNDNQYMDVIPTIRIKLQNNLYGLNTLRSTDQGYTTRVFQIAFYCGDSELPSKALNDYLIYISEYFRTKELDKINSKIDLYRKILPSVTDRTLKEKVADLLIANMELAFNIKNNVKIYPYDVIMPPTIVKILDEKEIKKLGSKGLYGGKEKSIVLISTGLAAFIFALLFVFFLENLQRMKKKDPEKFDLLKKYMRLRGDKKLR